MFGHVTPRCRALYIYSLLYRVDVQVKCAAQRASRCCSAAPMPGCSLGTRRPRARRLRPAPVRRGSTVIACERRPLTARNGSVRHNAVKDALHRVGLCTVGIAQLPRRGRGRSLAEGRQGRGAPSAIRRGATWREGCRNWATATTAATGATGSPGSPSPRWAPSTCTSAPSSAVT